MHICQSCQNEMGQISAQKKWHSLLLINNHIFKSHVLKLLRISINMVIVKTATFIQLKKVLIWLIYD